MAKEDEWERSKVKAFTGENGNAQYNPKILATKEAVRELETNAMAKGKIFGQRKNTVQFYFDAGRIVGACSGEFTNYVYVEMTNGEYHGRPMSWRELKRRGVTL